jgi:RNA polymerase sigma factor (sigma-70 family)
VSPEQTTPTALQLTLLDAVIAAVARAHRLKWEDRQDFAQSVHLRLAERKYDVFERFAGRSSLRTFLNVVVRRLLLDWRNTQHGKWRASAEAKRRGGWAIELERLVYRDGQPISEALTRLCARPDAPSRHSLAVLLGDLPFRPRRAFDAVLPDVPDSRIEDYAEAAERSRDRRQVSVAVVGALRALPPDERRLIALRYGRGQRIGDIAKAQRVDAKVLYRRVERAMRSLRAATRAARDARQLARSGDTPARPGVFRAELTDSL